MSSKLLMDDRATNAPAVEWPIVGGDTVIATTAVERPHPAQKAQKADDAPAAPDLSHVVAAQQHRIHDLEQELARRTREAFQQGHGAGTSEERQKSEQLLNPVMERLAHAIGEISGLRRHVRAEAEEDVVRLALAVARKILHREVTVDPESLLGLVKAAVRRIDARELHRVRMHPEDIPIIERNLTAAGLQSQVEVVADPGLERGGVVLETSRGSLDASISTQLTEIERGFVDLVRHSKEGH